MPLYRFCDVKGCEESYRIDDSNDDRIIPEKWCVIVRSVRIAVERPPAQEAVNVAQLPDGGVMGVRTIIPSPKPEDRVISVMKYICDKHEFSFDVKP